MLKDLFSQHAQEIPPLVEGLTARQVEPLIARLCEAQAWKLLGLVAVSAAELSARLIVDALVQHEQYAATVPCACLRRQLRPTVIQDSGLGSGVFRDLDAEEGAGIAEHIAAEAEEIAQAAAQRRRAAVTQAADVDHDAVRHYIVTRLSEPATLARQEAVDALSCIARGSAWEETRREAAMKLANNRGALQKLIQRELFDDLLTIGLNTGLQSARENLARQMGEKEPARSAVKEAAEGDPNPLMREAAGQMLAVWDQA